MYSYPTNKVQKKYMFPSQIKVRPKSPAFSPSISRSQSRHNEAYMDRKRRRALLKHQISPDSEKYLPPHLRSPSATTHRSHREHSVYRQEGKYDDEGGEEPNIKPYSIALKTPNTMVYQREEPKVAILSATNILRNIDQDIKRNNKFGVLSPQRPDTARSITYQEKNDKARATAWKLHTSSEREIALKRILGAQTIERNPLHQSAIGTLRVYQTDGFSYEQRTSCIIMTGLCLATLFVIFVIVFGEWI